MKNVCALYRVLGLQITLKPQILNKVYLALGEAQPIHRQSVFFIGMSQAQNTQPKSGKFTPLG